MYAANTLVPYSVNSDTDPDPSSVVCHSQFCWFIMMFFQNLAEIHINEVYYSIILKLRLEKSYSLHLSNNKSFSGIKYSDFSHSCMRTVDCSHFLSFVEAHLYLYEQKGPFEAF